MGEFVNTRYPEYAASFFNNYHSMIFTSRRPKKLNKRRKSNAYAEDLPELVYVSENFQGNWMKTRPLSGKFSRLFPDGIIHLSEDGNQAVYYDEKGSGDVFYAQPNEKGKWIPKKSFGDSINTNFREPYVHISKDSTLLFLVSTQPGGAGKEDIWWSKKSNSGEWKFPKIWVLS